MKAEEKTQGKARGRWTHVGGEGMQGCEEDVKTGAATDGWEEKAMNERDEERDNKTKTGGWRAVEKMTGGEKKSTGIRGMDRWRDRRTG